MTFQHRLDDTPDVSIVLPIRNEEPFIRACLERLLAQDYPTDRLEILVVDGDSTDSTRTIVEDVIRENPTRRIRLLHNEKRIVPPALNIGIRASTGDVVVRMDGHTVPDRDYVSACVRALHASGAANAGGLIRPEGDTPFGEAVALAQSHPLGAGDATFHYARQPHLTDTVYLGAYRKEIFATTGLFDESMVRNQDYEMNVRIRKSGGKIYLDPRIRSAYTPRGSPRALWKQYFEYGWWRVETLKRHPGSLRWRQAVPAVFVLGLIVLSAAAPFSWVARILLAIQVAAYLAALAVATFGVRSKVAGRTDRLARFPLALATIHVAWGSGFLTNVLSGGRFPHRAKEPIVPALATDRSEPRQA